MLTRLVCALALVASVPAAAAVPAHAAADPAATVRAAAALAQSNDCAGVLRLLDPLVAARPAVSPETRVSAQLLRMPCLASAGRSKEIAPVLAELQAKAPDNPLVLGFEVFAAMEAGHAADAADRLAALADTGSGALALMPGSLWRAMAQQLTIAHDDARRERTALALARAGWTPADQPDLAETLAIQGIGALLRENDPDQAGDLLTRVTRPGALWDMAIQRRYAALWPAIEARLGPQSGTAADRFARAALDAFATDADDDRVRLNAVRAFVALGRVEDVVATAQPIAIAPGMGEERVEIVLADAEARAASGDRPGAIARLLPFAKLDLATTPEAASALISLAELYHDSGRFADELALARATPRGATSPFSAFGAAWLRRNEACALAGLGRTDEARAVGETLKAGAADNEAAAVEGLLCLHRDDEATAIALAALATPDGTDRLADQFQPDDSLFLHPRSTLRALWSRLLARAEVKAAFDHTARVLPRAYWPAATPRAVPVLPGAVQDGATTT